MQEIVLGDLTIRIWRRSALPRSAIAASSCGPSPPSTPGGLRRRAFRERSKPAAMQEIADWLAWLGLPEYAGAFAENGIDVFAGLQLVERHRRLCGAATGRRLW
jgi:hypothetical protein